MEKMFSTLFFNAVHQRYHMKQQYAKEWKIFKNQIQWWREENIKQLDFNKNGISNPSVHRKTTVKTTLKLEQYNSFLQIIKQDTFSHMTRFTLKENVNSQTVHQVPLHNLQLRSQCTVSVHKIKRLFVYQKNNNC
jgi:hypothetical protein